MIDQLKNYISKLEYSSNCSDINVYIRYDQNQIQGVTCLCLAAIHISLFISSLILFKKLLNKFNQNDRRMTYYFIHLELAVATAANFQFLIDSVGNFFHAGRGTGLWDNITYLYQVLSADVSVMYVYMHISLFWLKTVNYIQETLFRRTLIILVYFCVIFQPIFHVIWLISNIFTNLQDIMDQGSYYIIGTSQCTLIIVLFGGIMFKKYAQEYYNEAYLKFVRTFL